MVRHITNNRYSELWKKQQWKKLRLSLFRLQRRVYKAVQAGDLRKARSLQKLILKSLAAGLLAVRQVSQLNQGKRTPGIDGIAKLSFKERFRLTDLLKRRKKEEGRRKKAVLEGDFNSP